MFSNEAPQDISYWQERLYSLFPPDSELSHLRIHWEPGFEWDPVGRWMLYQMLPPERVPLIFLPMLEGPDPRTFTRYDPVKKEVIRHPDAPLISSQQWHMYRDSGGYFGMPYWVVQGENGGHKVKFTQTERMIARMKGHPTGEPPLIGDRPYAPFDERVIEKVVELDQMRTYDLLVSFAHRSPEMLDIAEERGANEARDRLWEWISDQVGDWISDLPRSEVKRLVGQT